jgi:prophage regulatory protein
MEDNSKDTSKFKLIAREPLRFEITEVHENTWRDWEQQGLAPKSIPLGPRARGWLISELRDWVQQRAAQRDATT